MNTRPSRLATAAVAACLSTSVAAETPLDIQQSLETAARQESAHFDDFSGQRGEAFFNSTHGREWSCASCHTTNPLNPGRHAKTNKAIAPLAPQANPERFTRPEKVEKWFRRNCNDVVGHPCTATEKGDILVYLISLTK